MRAAVETKSRQLVIRSVVISAFAFVATSMAIAGCTDLTGPKSPETPINVTAALMSNGTSVRVDWQASPQSDGVISYNIIRNGTKIGESTGTSFTDTDLPEVTTFTYAVSANCTSGELSEPSPVTAASTVTTLDVTPPQVTTFQPPNGFNGVSTGATVTATFSEPMDPATMVSTSTFTLKVTATGALIPGTISYTPATRIAEFKPASNLPSSTNITATITTGVKDAHGVALAANVSWTFTTADVIAPTVIATNPANGAGGVSTTVPNITVTFSEPMDANSINTTTITLQRTSTGTPVTGTVAYNAASRTASFTPSGPLLPGVTYTVTVASTVRDVAGNTMGADFTFSFTTADTSPPTLTATAPANLATGVPTNVVVTATFSEAMDPNTINTTTFTLKVGSTNVAGTVAYNPATLTATFTPSSPLSPSTAYVATVTNGAKDLAGNALAPSIIPNPWTFTTVDNAPPTVTAVSPSNGAINVPVSATVNITFSEPMDVNTINGTTITLKNTATNAAVAGVVSYNNATNVATFTPNVNLAQGTGYTVTVTTGVKDLAGNAMAAQFTSTFTTVSAPDITPPTVTSVSPASGSTTAPPNTKVYVTFSEPMNATTITTTTVNLRVTATMALVPGTVSYNAGMNMAIFSPTAPLLPSTGYTVTVTTGVRDVAGNALASQFTSTFTTAAGADATPPTVTAVSPTNGATGISVSSPVTVTFSEAMDPTTITATTFTLRNTVTGVVVSGAVSYNSITNIATLSPSASLTPATGYTVTVTSGAAGVKDLAGNALVAQFTSTFTTAP